MSTTKIASRGWYHAIGKATEQLHSERFPAVLMEALQRAFTYDTSLILRYPPDSTPVVIYEDDPLGIIEKKGHISYYLDGIYLLDPFYQLSLQNPDPGSYLLRDIVPDHFHRSEFYRRYFLYCNLKDELNYLLPLEQVGTIVISIGCSRRFNRAELERFRTIEPWVLSMMKSHWGIPSNRQKTATENMNLHKQLTASFQNFGRSQLTDRECDIAQLILKGHSTKSAAAKLNISVDTVKFHRRNLYKKLDIQTQPELFSLFLNALSAQEKYAEHSDPLTAYLSKQ